MCGIVGATGPRSAERVAHLLGLIGHRGPDARGVWESGSVAFGHARLAILDPSERSAQPFRRHGRTLVYNGEIYNHVELRRELEADGARFTTSGDTEVLVELLQRWGTPGLDRIEGMFAAAMWDERNEALTLVRDRHGIKPLYWATHDDGVAFASELTPLADPAGRDIDPAAVREFLRFGSPISRPVSTSVHEVRPGTMVRFDARGAIDVSTFRGERPHASESPTASLHRSIGEHARSDRAVALFLSGGFDSAAILSGLVSRGVEPLCLTLATSHNREDVARARDAARHYGVEHEVATVDTRRLATAVEGFLRSMDQPTVDGFNTYLISEVCRSFDHPVALSGLGGDEVLGGYRYYGTESRLRSIERPLARLPKALRRHGAKAAAAAMRRSSARVTELVEARGTAARHRAFRALFSDDEIATLTGHRPPQATHWDVDPDADARRQLAALDAATYLQPTLLRDADVFSMWHGIELRVPFVDTRVRDAVLTSGRPPTKLELATAWGDDFLVAKASEPKLTFRLPWEQWLGAIGESAREIVETSDPWHGFVRPEHGRDVLRRAADGHAEPLRPWSLLVLAGWLDLRGTERRSPTADIAMRDLAGTSAPTPTPTADAEVTP